MKTIKIIPLLLVLGVAGTTLTGCGKSQSTMSTQEQADFKPKPLTPEQQAEAMKVYQQHLAAVHANTGPPNVPGGTATPGAAPVTTNH